MGIMMARLPRRSGVEISLNIVKGLGHGTNIFLGHFKGTVPRDFRLKVFFFHESVSPKLLSISLGPFHFFATGVNDIGGAP